jgi:hypothetical protein
MLNMNKIKLLFANLALSVCAFSFSAANADWSGPDDGSGYWGPAFCDTKPSDFTGICTATPTVFRFTINQFRLRKSNDQTFFNLASGPQTFDFTSASAGAELGSFVAGVAVPPAEYDAMSFVAEQNVVIKGSTALNSGAGPTCRTSASGVSTDGGAAEEYVASNNNTPLFDVIVAGSDEVEGAQTGPGIEINYINPSNELVFVGDTIGGVSFPITTTTTSILNFRFSMRPVKGIVFEFNNGVCTDAFSGDLRIDISANVVEP